MDSVIALEEFSVGFRAQRSWGLLIALGLFLGGLGAGLYLVSLPLGYPLGSLLGILIMGLGALSFLVDLGRPQRFWRAFLRPASSWISRGVLFMLLFGLFGLLALAPYAIPALPWGSGTALGRTFEILAALSAFGVMLYTGFVLSTPASISFWNTALLPVQFLVYALLGGIDVIFIARALQNVATPEGPTLEFLQMVLLIASLLFILFYLSIMSSATLSARQSVRLLIQGELSGLFLGGVILVGLAVPILVAGAAFLGGLVVGPVVLAFMSLLILLGSFFFRYTLLKAGLYAPPI